ncbi:MAG: ATP-binding protein [Comamonadaceae bacterium]|nr:ATP-binding protein [Comamonadaceae bacterium]
MPLRIVPTDPAAPADTASAASVVQHALSSLPRVSLQRRLWWAASGLIVIGLTVAAIGLNGLFRSYVDVDLAQRMQRHLDDLIGAASATVEPTPAGPITAPAALAQDQSGAMVSVAPASSVRLQREPADPLFRQPASGLYWLIFLPDGEVLKSRSWWDQEPGFDAPSLDTLDAGETVRLNHIGPGGEPLAIWMRRVQMPGVDGSVVFAAGADASHLTQASSSFARSLALSLLLLAAVLILAVTLQVRMGLTPLKQLQTALGQLRAGQRQRLEGRFPAEVQPLVDDLNRLLADNQALVARAQAQAGNLAHALKTPLSVLNNVSQEADSRHAQVMQSAVAHMQRQIDLHLMRSRASASAHGGRSRAVLNALMPPLLRTMGTLHKGLALTQRDSPPLQVRMDAHDLQEVVGNLLDNACCWARGRVTLAWQAEGNDALLWIDDDGPGIAPEAREAAMRRGTRLDERQPGSGLGLSIVNELLDLYGGTLRLATSPWGGLRAEVRIPRVHD